MAKIIDRTGEIGYNNQGLKMCIEKYINKRNIDVKFENNYIAKNRCYEDFKRGQIKNPYFPSVCGVGYLGEGKYKTYKNGNYTKEYKFWHEMIRRCYGHDKKERNPTYENCVVCEEWHNFQIFAKWFEENYYEIEGERMCFDKDILVKGNKIYSPNTCCFVPICINNLFVKNNKNRGKLPIGVYKEGNKYVANLYKNKAIRLGSFDTEIQAFNIYKKYKEKHIKDMANKYKYIIPNNLYNAMYDYIVEIID